jgi:hypothetical protein
MPIQPAWNRPCGIAKELFGDSHPGTSPPKQSQPGRVRRGFQAPILCLTAPASIHSRQARSAQNHGIPDTHSLSHGLRIHSFAARSFGAKPRPLVISNTQKASARRSANGGCLASARELPARIRHRSVTYRTRRCPTARRTPCTSPSGQGFATRTGTCTPCQIAWSTSSCTKATMARSSRSIGGSGFGNDRPALPGNLST